MFPLIKIRLTFKALQDIDFPYYAGSSLRGVFGKSLRRVSCLITKAKCTECAVIKTCPYASVFENGYTTLGKGEEVPNPYVIEPMPLGQKQVRQGDSFSFEQIIFGTAVEKLSYILLAWVKTGNLGFTKERTPAVLLRIEQITDNGDILLLHDLENPFAETDTANSLYTPPAMKKVKRLRIVLETPLRIHRFGHPIIPDAFNAKDFLLSLIRKQLNMAKYHIADFPYSDKDTLYKATDSVRIEKADLHWLDWKRYSSRQQKEIALGGIIGSFDLCGDLTIFYPHIIMGQLFHCGKSTVMGLGKYRVLEHCE